MDPGLLTHAVQNEATALGMRNLSTASDLDPELLPSHGGPQEAVRCIRPALAKPVPRQTPILECEV